MKFEEKLIAYTCLILSIVLPITTVLNIILKLGVFVFLLTLAGSLIFPVFYFLAVKKHAFQAVKYGMTALLLVYLNLGWYANNGSKGPMLMSFIVFVAYMVFIWKKQQIPFFFGFVLLNLAALFAIEISGSHSFRDYSSESARIIDNYTGLFIYVILMYSFSAFARKNYMQLYMNARQSDELKTAFLANLSHEIRTPLNAIVGFSGLLADAKDSQIKNRYAGIIQSNGEHLTRLIDDILDISMIESNQLAISPEKIHLEDFLRKLVIEAENEKGNYKKSAIKIVCSNQLDNPVIFTDRLRIKQILSNLVSNAIKFTSRGAITISVFEEGSQYRFQVSDTGIGIKSENFELLFKRFHKIEAGANQLYRGNGLGLYLCKQLVELLGGSIGFESVYGAGSAFWFTIPGQHMQGKPKRYIRSLPDSRNKSA